MLARNAFMLCVAIASGATASSAHLKRNGGKAYYAVSDKVKGDRKTMHATVDANTGASVPVAPSAAAKPAAKKPS